MMGTLDQNESKATWAFIWILLTFKIGTVAITFWAAGITTENVAVLTTTTWPWLIIPALAIAGPIIFRMRLRKQRARRAELLRSEWIVEKESKDSAHV